MWSILCFPLFHACASFDLSQHTHKDLHEVFNAVLYLLESGCQWRMLPEGFPKWRTVHSYFAKWSDAGKKVSGIKRHIAVDTQGLPHVIAVTTAEVTDRNGALQAIDRCRPNLELVESVLVDGGLHRATLR